MSGWKLWVSLGPFLVSGIYIVISQTGLLGPASDTKALVLVFGLLTFVIVPAIGGLMRGLPLWSITSLGFVIGIAGLSIFSSWINFLPPLPHTSSISGKVFQLMIGQFIFFGHMLLLSTLLVLAASRLSPLRSFYVRLCRDWSLFSLLLFGSLMPLIILIVFDAYQGSMPYQISTLLILMAGVWLYLGRSEPGPRLQVLLIAVGLTMTLAGLGRYLLYPHQPWSTYTTFPRWWEGLVPLIQGAVLLAIITLPLSFSLFPMRRTQAKEAG